jgi:prepilin-type N-terminal cleavage/methylation domain-containing protein
VGGKAKSPSLRGFTLIELILVLVIIGFITSLVAPAITSSTGLRLKTTVRRLAAGLRFARSQAVITGNTYQVIFDVENGAMAIEPVEQETPYDLQEYGEGDTGEEDAGAERRALKRRQYCSVERKFLKDRRGWNFILTAAVQVEIFL